MTGTPEAYALLEPPPPPVTGEAGSGGAAPPAILLVGFDASAAGEVAARLRAPLPVVVLDGPEQALESLADGSVAVLCLGAGVAGDAACRLLEDAARDSLLESVVCVVLAGGPDLAPFQGLIDGDRLFYLGRRPPRAREVRRLLEGAVASSRLAAAGESRAEDDLLVRLAEPLQAVSGLEQASVLLAEAAESSVAAERAWCLLYDPVDEVLRAPERDGLPARAESAVSGLVSYVLRTGEPVLLERVGDDPRYDPEADNDGGPPGRRFLAAPVVPPMVDSPAAGAFVMAVLVAVRAPEAPGFADRDRRALEFLAAQVAWPLKRLVVAEVAERRRLLESPFRREAVEHRERGEARPGRPLELSPPWMRRASALLPPLLAAALSFLAFGTVDHTARGAAVVRIGEGAAEDTTGAVRVQGGGRPPATAPPGVVVAALPERYRPSLEPGMPLRLVLSGHPGVHHDLVVTEVAAEPLEAGEALRVLGSGPGAAPAPAGPVVLVRAELAAGSFRAAGREHRYRDGMTGSAEVRVGSDRVLFALLPGFRRVPDGDG